MQSIKVFLLLALVSMFTGCCGDHSYQARQIRAEDREKAGQLFLATLKELNVTRGASSDNVGMAKDAALTVYGEWAFPPMTRPKS